MDRADFVPIGKRKPWAPHPRLPDSRNAERHKKLPCDSKSLGPIDSPFDWSEQIMTPAEFLGFLEIHRHDFGLMLATQTVLPKAA
jgi:hypothetical protein